LNKHDVQHIRLIQCNMPLAQLEHVQVLLTYFVAHCN